jgi:hypothetical protein
MNGSIHPHTPYPVYGVNFTCSLINAQTVVTQLVRLDFKSSLSLAQSINANSMGTAWRYTHTHLDMLRWTGSNVLSIHYMDFIWYELIKHKHATR